MAKKRPRTAKGQRRAHARQFRSRLDRSYWKRRLFRNTFTYQGHSRQVDHWCVKIQHLGRRRTFSLRAGKVAQASAEALEIYKRILHQGWDAFPVSNGQSAQFDKLPSKRLNRDGLRRAYWTERLVHRKYTEKLHPAAPEELSVRIDHEEVSQYLPLQTN